jgi:hypothetical protein
LAREVVTAEEFAPESEIGNRVRMGFSRHVPLQNSFFAGSLTNSESGRLTTQ